MRRYYLSTWLSSFLVILVFLKNPNRVKALLKFTSLKCEFADKEIGEFQLCKITAVSRKKSTVSFRWKFKKTIYNCPILFQFTKRSSTGQWYPWLYKTTFDACDYFKHPKRYPLAHTVTYFMQNYTNYNRTCPFKSEDEFFLDSFCLDEFEVMKYLPIEVGEYGLNSIWYTNNKKMFSVNGTVSYSNYKQRF